MDNIKSDMIWYIAIIMVPIPASLSLAKSTVPSFSLAEGLKSGSLTTCGNEALASKTSLFNSVNIG